MFVCLFVHPVHKELCHVLKLLYCKFDSKRVVGSDDNPVLAGYGCKFSYLRMQDVIAITRCACLLQLLRVFLYSLLYS